MSDREIPVTHPGHCNKEKWKNEKTRNNKSYRNINKLEGGASKGAGIPRKGSPE